MQRSGRRQFMKQGMAVTIGTLSRHALAGERGFTPTSSTLVTCLRNPFTVHWVVDHIRRFHPGSRVQDSRAWLHMGFEAVFCRNNR